LLHSGHRRDVGADAVDVFRCPALHLLPRARTGAP
jgi:hypothetical protein